jgi:hypothetical protein
MGESEPIHGVKTDRLPILSISGSILGAPVAILFPGRSLYIPGPSHDWETTKAPARSKPVGNPLVGGIKLHFPVTEPLDAEQAGYVSAVVQSFCGAPQQETVPCLMLATMAIWADTDEAPLPRA